MKSDDRLRLDRAFVLDKDTFCVVFSGKDYEDMHSHIITYERRLEQPWTRSDVPCKIDGLTGRMGEDGRPIIHALSDEGDLYTLQMGTAPTHQKIEGAGVYSDDATDLGYVNSIAQVGSALFVTGYHSQLYRLTETSVDWFHKDRLPKTPASYDSLIFGDLSATSETDIYMSVIYSPTSTNRALTEEEEDLMRELFQQGRNDEAIAIREASQGPSRVYEGRLYHWNGNAWRIVATPRSGKYYPEPATLSDIFIETKDKVWAVGDNGVILIGNADDGFQDVSFKDNRDGLRSITKFKDRMVIASDYALHWFDGHMLSSLAPALDPTINDGIPNPVKVQAVDEILFYFDSKHGIQTFDGSAWTAIDIPAELLEQDVAGFEDR
ncbi:hypothetical protein [Xanthomonas sp. 3058]|uniref:hypothetical protein n=1 Tax=Xanthomonas sp. 3058 TaxID=3035314 RepID=UPI00161F548B|nr:hypothetical protein [Xanthomonas sp. 3058]MBB5864453.1 hypothetical protein [Xanthomonas sp. 3058]